MTRDQACRCHDIVLIFDGFTYLVKSARIDFWPAAGPLIPPEVRPRDKRDAEVYRVEDDGLQMFMCWLAEAPAAFRATYARRFLQEVSGGTLTALPGSLATRIEFSPTPDNPMAGRCRRTRTPYAKHHRHIRPSRRQAQVARL
jgi:hypothetical protein